MNSLLGSLPAHGFSVSTKFLQNRSRLFGAYFDLLDKKREYEVITISGVCGLKDCIGMLTCFVRRHLTPLLVPLQLYVGLTVAPGHYAIDLDRFHDSVFPWKKS